ncbi:M28 family metallopeptidase [Bacteroidota bacterium]
MRNTLFIFFLLLAQLSVGQDLDYAHQVLEELCADDMAGRGYVEDGDNAAAYYIEQEFKANGLFAWEFNYYQTFYMAVNTFPGKVKLLVNSKPLKAGKDFLVSADAPSISGKYELTYLEKLPEIEPSGRVVDSTVSYKGFVVLADSLIASIPQAMQTLLLNGFKKAGAKGIIRLTDEKLTWTVAKQQAPLAQLIVANAGWEANAASIEVDIESEFEKKHRTQNVVAFVEGSEEPDKFIVFTAHYDHLGKMGEDVIFKGANDNASGISMLLNLAKYYAAPENQPRTSIAFVAFAAEEAGLLGSKYYVEQPIFPLSDIAFLVNLDIVGTGDDGITVANATEHTKEFDLLSKINEDKGFLVKVKERGKAAISDHHPFSEAGVPCFYMYTMGGIKAYHDVYDVPDTLPLTGFEGLFLLLTNFVERL